MITSSVADELTFQPQLPHRLQHHRLVSAIAGQQYLAAPEPHTAGGKHGVEPVGTGTANGWSRPARAATAPFSP